MDNAKEISRLVEQSIKNLNDQIKRKNQEKDNLEKDIELLKKEHQGLSEKVNDLSTTVNGAIKKALELKQAELEKALTKAKEEGGRAEKARIDAEGLRQALNTQIQATVKAKEKADRARDDLDASKKETDILKDKLTGIYEAIKGVI